MRMRIVIDKQMRVREGVSADMLFVSKEYRPDMLTQPGENPKLIEGFTRPVTYGCVQAAVLC